MSFAHIQSIVEVSNLTEANQLIETGLVLLQILPGKTSDGDPCTLFYLGEQKPNVADDGGSFFDGDWIDSEKS